MKTILTSIGLLIALFVHAQTDLRSANNFSNNLANELRYSKLVRGDNKDAYLENPWEQYLFKDFQEGILTLTDGRKIENGFYNYNILNEDVQFILKGDTFSIEKPRNIMSLTIGDKKLCYTSYVHNNNVYAGFFEQFNEGKYKLLYKRKLLFVEAQASSGYVESKPPHYKTIKEYYLLKENKVAFKIKNKKELIKYFDEEGIAVKPIFKSEKIKFSKPNSLKKLFEKVNSN